MVLFPDVQRRAQEEIRSITGNDRLPGLEDRDAIPYIGQILLETMRWHSVTPNGEPNSPNMQSRVACSSSSLTLGGPHQSNRDDVYDGYLIPEGTAVFVNTW